MVSDDTPSKSDSSSAATDPSTGYSRGENQKPVSRAYKDNWQAIFGKGQKSKTTKASVKKKKR